MAQPMGGAGQGDNSLAPLWITVGIFLLGLVIWYFGHDLIVRAVFAVRSWEIALIEPFTDNLDIAKHTIETANISEVEFDQLISLSNAVGEYLSWPVAILLGAMAIVIYFGDVGQNFRNSYNMATLKAQEQENWPQIKPVSKLDLVKEDIDKGPWAIAMNPMRYAKSNNLIQEVLEPRREGMLERTNTVKAALRRGAARRVFAMQLGRLWTGVDGLNNYTKALFAIFAARINRDSGAATDLVRQIARSTETGKLDFSGVSAVLKKYQDTKSVQKVVAGHAYVFTVMASMLEAARDDGVVATADFLWLKAVDRRLWYTLNVVGRQTCFAEVGGIFSHWKVEKEMARPLHVPMIEEAVVALETAINEIIYQPDEEQETA